MYITRGVPDQQVIVHGSGFPLKSSIVRLDSQQGRVSVLSNDLLVIKNLEVVNSIYVDELHVKFDFKDVEGDIVALNVVSFSIGVIDFPHVSQTKLNIFEGSTVALAAEKVFDDLLLECHFDNGSIVHTATVLIENDRENRIECQDHRPFLTVGIH